MLSGPDEPGRIAYTEDHFFVSPDKNRRHLLKVIHLDGSGDTALFTRPGDALWAESAAGHGEIGHVLSLAPVGGRVAVLSGLTVLQMPSTYLSQGSIEIWNIDQKTGNKTDLLAVDEGLLVGSTDGKRLAYVKIVDRNSNAKVNDPADPIADSFLKWNWGSNPRSVHLRCGSQNRKRFCMWVGSPSSRLTATKVIIGDRDGNFYCVDLAAGQNIFIDRTGQKLAARHA